MPRLPYQLIEPVKLTTSVIFASPHSGRDYPWSFIRNSHLDELTIRSSEDAFVDQLFARAPDFGAPLLCAVVPRAYVDLNRSEDELDPALIYGVKQRGHNPRLSSGLGVIPRVVAGGREIRSGKMSLAEAKQRLERFYHPYHGQLQQLMTAAQAGFGQSILLDCHSMPRDALLTSGISAEDRPDVVLGDRFGQSCDGALMAEVEAVFAKSGLKVARNQPYAGAFVTQNYGRPAKGQHVIQVEIDRGLYMDEARIQPNANFPEFQQIITGIMEDLTRLGAGKRRLAAE